MSIECGYVPTPRSRGAQCVQQSISPPNLKPQRGDMSLHRVDAQLREELMNLPANLTVHPQLAC